MNLNFNLKCIVCDNIVRIKLLAGYVADNNFIYSCPECRIKIHGKVVLDEEGPNFIKEYVLNNAIEVETKYTGGNESHMLQLATEFFTSKLSKVSFKGSAKKNLNLRPELFMSPFILENVDSDIKARKISFLRHISDNFEKDFVTSKRIWELYKTGNKKYLSRQLLEGGFVEPVKIGMVLKVNYQEKILDVIYKPFLPFLIEGKIINQLKKYKETLIAVKNKNPEEIKALKSEMHNIIENADMNILQLLNNFKNHYNLVLPIILNDIYKIEKIDDIKFSKGILTTDFEYIKNYYVDNYEIICSFLPILLGIQNINYRKSKDSFEPEISKAFPTIKSLVDYRDKVVNKGNKLKYFKNESIFNDYFNLTKILDNDIRNSIGHCSYSYDPDDQLIVFRDRNKTIHLYLIEFCLLLYSTFKITFYLLETINILDGFTFESNG